MGQLEEMIIRADSVLENSGPLEEQNLLIGDYILAYQKQIRDFSDASVDLSKLEPDTIDLRSVRSIRTLLVALKEKRDHELAVANANTSRASMSFSQTQTVTTTITYTQAINQVNELPADVLTIDQKKELAGLLSELEESKGKGVGRLAKAGKAVADWLFDQGIKAIPTVMPYLTQVVRGAVGA